MILLLSADLFQQERLITYIKVFKNGLDPDQDRHSVGPDLCPNCLQSLCNQQMTKIESTSITIRSSLI